MVKGKIVKEWHHGQYMIRHFRKVIQLAAKYKLNIITHGPIKDTGIRRKYPNYISSLVLTVFLTLRKYHL